MENDYIEFFIQNKEKLFKQITNLDLKNHTKEEYQEWYHNTERLIAEYDKYEAEILRSTEQIIEERDYSQLIHVLRNYDYYVKLAQGKTDDKEYPFWCRCYGFKDSETNMEE